VLGSHVHSGVDELLPVSWTIQVV